MKELIMENLTDLNYYIYIIKSCSEPTRLLGDSFCLGQLKGILAFTYLHQVDKVKEKKYTLH